MEAVTGKEISPDIHWTPPKPDQAARVMLSRLDRRIQLEAEEYTAKEFCELGKPTTD